MGVAFNKENYTLVVLANPERFGIRERMKYTAPPSPRTRDFVTVQGGPQPKEYLNKGQRR